VVEIAHSRDHSFGIGVIFTLSIAIVDRSARNLAKVRSPILLLLRSSVWERKEGEGRELKRSVRVGRWIRVGSFCTLMRIIRNDIIWNFQSAIQSYAKILPGREKNPIFATTSFAHAIRSTINSDKIWIIRCQTNRIWSMPWLRKLEISALYR
jgi:hypothetical protein